VPAVRAFVDFLVEVLHADTHVQDECPLQEDVRAALAARAQPGDVGEAGANGAAIAAVRRDKHAA
jgi:hypothetical protein